MHTSLLWKVVIYGRKKLNNIGPSLRLEGEEVETSITIEREGEKDTGEKGGAVDDLVPML